MTSVAIPRAVWWVRLSWFWFVLLAPLVVFSNGRWQIAVVALASPFIARLFLFSQPALKGLLIFLPLQLGGYLVMWWEVIPAPGILYYIIAATYGLCHFVPFAVDRIMSTRIAGFASTLILPVCWFLVEILIQLFTPYGSWSSVGYTQMGHGLLTPLAAWIGVAGVAFATLWIASATSWFVISTAPVRRRAINVAVWAGAVVALVWLAKPPAQSELRIVQPLTVAAITPSYDLTRRVDLAMRAATRKGETDAADLAGIDSIATELNDDLILRSRDAAQSGARLIVWSETAGRILGSQEHRILAKGQEVAREEGAYLFIGIGVWHPGQQPPRENKVVAIMPSGKIAWQYRKAKPIVGSEAPFLPPGHNELAILDTPFGRLGLVICHDLDFADFMVQAGRKEVDLLLAPSADWSAIADLHARMGIMRGVENGFWLLRPAYAGKSVIASPAGHVTHSQYDAELESRVFVGQIPIMRNTTMYPQIQSYLPLVALVLLAGLLVIAWRHRH